MKLVGTLPRLGGLAELHTYRCEPCNYEFTETVGPAERDRAMLLDMRARPEDSLH